MRVIDKLTSAVVRLANRLSVVPVIIEPKPGKFDTVVGVIRGFISEGRFGRIVSEVTDIFPIFKTIPTFEYIATILPREWVFDLADAAEVKKVYPNRLKLALKYPVVPREGIFQCEYGAFKELEPFTSTYYTKRLIGANKAHQKGYFGSGIRVAVCDTGIDRRHMATRHMLLDSVMAQVRDENGHGQWCSACVGGRYAEDKYLGRKIGKKIPSEGIAPSSTVVAIKCLGYLFGIGSDDLILKAIELALHKYKADIINMSLGGSIEDAKQEDDPYYKVAKELKSYGVIFSVAAGNEGPDPKTISSPGWLEDVLTVGAYDPITGEIASFSSRGPTPDGRIKPDCIAPGVRVHAPCCGLLDKVGDNTALNNFSPLNGTSMATPHVSGLLALMREAHSKILGKVLTVDEVKQMLEALGHEKTNEAGWGLISWDMYETWMETQYGVKV